MLESEFRIQIADAIRNSMQVPRRLDSASVYRSLCCDFPLMDSEKLLVIAEDIRTRISLTNPTYDGFSGIFCLSDKFIDGICSLDSKLEHFDCLVASIGVVLMTRILDNCDRLQIERILFMSAGRESDDAMISQLTKVCQKLDYLSISHMSGSYWLQFDMDTNLRRLVNICIHSYLQPLSNWMMNAELSIALLESLCAMMVSRLTSCNHSNLSQFTPILHLLLQSDNNTLISLYWSFISSLCLSETVFASPINVSCLYSDHINQ